MPCNSRAHIIAPFLVTVYCWLPAAEPVLTRQARNTQLADAALSLPPRTPGRCQIPGSGRIKGAVSRDSPEAPEGARRGRGRPSAKSEAKRLQPVQEVTENGAASGEVTGGQDGMRRERLAARSSGDSVLRGDSTAASVDVGAIAGAEGVQSNIKGDVLIRPGQQQTAPTSVDAWQPLPGVLGSSGSSIGRGGVSSMSVRGKSSSGEDPLKNLLEHANIVNRTPPPGMSRNKHAQVRETKEVVSAFPPSILIAPRSLPSSHNSKDNTRELERENGRDKTEHEAASLVHGRRPISPQRPSAAELAASTLTSNSHSSGRTTSTGHAQETTGSSSSSRQKTSGSGIDNVPLQKQDSQPLRASKDRGEIAQHQEPFMLIATSAPANEPSEWRRREAKKDEGNELRRADAKKDDSRREMSPERFKEGERKREFKDREHVEGERKRELRYREHERERERERERMRASNVHEGVGQLNSLRSSDSAGGVGGGHPRREVRSAEEGGLARRKEIWSPSDMGLSRSVPPTDKSGSPESAESVEERRKRSKIATSGSCGGGGGGVSEEQTSSHDRIKVCVRKRPLSEKELARDHKDIIHCNAASESALTVIEHKKRLDLTEYVGESM